LRSQKGRFEQNVSLEEQYQLDDFSDVGSDEVRGDAGTGDRDIPDYTSDAFSIGSFVQDLDYQSDILSDKD
jgi:hypothetical protein